MAPGPATCPAVARTLTVVGRTTTTRAGADEGDTVADEQPDGTRGKNPVSPEGHLPVNEILGEYQGANSPFGDDREFPLAVDKLAYTHPDPDAVTRGE